LTYRIDQLVDRGLVERVPCDTDRRGSFARLSDDGWALVGELAPTHVAGVRRYLFDEIDALELGLLTAFLERSLARLDDARETAPVAVT
jgi:DNA-binding MarR family transcriptional regulator